MVAVAPTVKLRVVLPPPNLAPDKGTLQVKFFSKMVLPPEFMATVLFAGKVIV